MTRKIMRKVWESCVSVLLSSTMILLVAGMNAVESLRMCESAKRVSFLGFVPPCQPQISQTAREVHNKSLSQTRESLQGCDVLVPAAIELAVEKIKGNLDILANLTLDVHLLPDSDTEPGQVSLFSF